MKTLPEYLTEMEGRVWTLRNTARVLMHIAEIERTYRELLTDKMGGAGQRPIRLSLEGVKNAE